jgi:hypothetical protein
VPASRETAHRRHRRMKLRQRRDWYKFFRFLFK